MELLGDVAYLELLSNNAQLEARFSLFGDSANLDARKVHSLW
jgi:hypothetical protein